MQSSKFIKQLKLLSKAEIKAFFRFVQSPYHNSVKILVPLLEETLQYTPDFKHENLERNTLLMFIYPKSEKENKGRINVLFTQLLKLLEEFRTIETFKADKLLYQQIKMQSYESIRLDKSFFKAAKEYENLLKQMPKDEKHALASFLHYERVYQHPGTNIYERNSIPFQQCLFFLEQSFLRYNLAYILHAKNRNRVLNSEAEIPVFILDHYDKEFKNSPSLSFYKALIDLQDNEDLFQETVLLFKASYLKIPFSLQKEGIAILLNIGMKKIRNGETKLKYDLFALYKIGLKYKLFLKNEQIKGNTFVNIASTAAFCQNYEWAYTFIQTHKDTIVKQERKDALKLAQAYVYYHKAIQSKKKSDFNEAINYLIGIQFKGIFYFYRVNILLLRAYYEYLILNNNDYFFVLGQITVFEQQLKRKKQLLGASKYQLFANFAIILRNLIVIKEKKYVKDNDIKDLKKKIFEQKHLFAREWLLSKLGELN